jgi:hypothetical protein
VVNIKNPSTSCIVNSLSITRLAHVVLVEPSIVLLSQHGEQKEKRRSLLTPTTICAHPSVKVGSVTSTSLELDEDLKVFAMLQKECKFQHTFSYQSSIEAGAIVKEDVLLKYNSFNLQSGSTQSINQSNYVGKIHMFEQFYVHTSVVAFMYPVRSNIDWVSNHDNASLVCGTSKATLVACTIDIKLQIEASLHRYRDWKRVLLLDRPVGWIAYDGGIVPQDLGTSSIRGINEASSCSSFNSLEGAKKSITAGGRDRNRTILNIDLVMTVDNVNVAMHTNEGFGPIKFEQNSAQSLSSMTFKEAQNSLRNPCLPSNLIHLWLDENNYHSFDTCRGCSQSVANAKQFLDDIALGWDTDIIFDLKAPQDVGQEIQVQQILSEIKNDSRSEADRQKLLERVKIRYFSNNNKLDILPVHVFEKINSSRFPSELKVYINAPSKLTCLRLAQWAREKNTHLAGCFVIEGDIDITRSWQELSDKSQITNTLASMKDVKLICDVPRKQLHPDVSLWKNGLVMCVEDGYDWIHYPFPVSSKADNSMPSSSVLTSIVLDETLFKDSFFHALDLTRSKSHIVSAWQDYVSHWGITSPFDWKPHQQHWLFVGEQQQDIMVQAVLNKSKNIFRCVTKILTVMLFLRLEELGLLSIDDAINNLPYKVTWRHVFTNTAGVDGKDAGNKFVYSNSLWSHVSDFVMTVTGVPFVEAVEYYILNPIGLSGSYDVNTLFPPFTARGFTGSHEDLLLIGSTLASGGVSPKTRLRVISTSSTDEMLKDWTRSQNVTASFEKDETVKSMKRFQYDGDNSFPFGVVDGYGMGIWLVKGWRTKGHQTSHVRGWLAMGSSEAIMYFDTDDLVVGMCAPKQILGLELTAPFAKVVRDLGSRLEDEAYLNPIVSHEFRNNKQLRVEPRL